MKFTKKITKKIFNILIRNNLLWNIIFRKMIILSNHIEKEKAIISSNIDINIFLDKNFPNLIVSHGIFKGMKYPEKNSVGSSLCPKLIGSYERELIPLFKEIFNNNYSEIIDIGCAEGYYAVGLAIRVKSANIFAFDIDLEAVRLCNEMALINSVANRVNATCIVKENPLELVTLTEKALIIVDCEGCEKHIFNKKTIKKLKNHDILIEIHDLIDIQISSYIKFLFKKSHGMKIINSIDDIKKAQQYDYTELKGLSLEARKQILAERRSSIMEWFYLTPM